MLCPLRLALILLSAMPLPAPANPAPAPLAVAGGSAADTTSAPRGKETVVLLHGIGMGGWSMTRLASALRREGYRVVNLSYPSRTVPLDRLAREWLPAQLAAHDAASAPRLHFVAHSMGGIMLRAWLAEFPRTGAAFPANLGRTVMIAPPNHGSEAAERLSAFPPYRWFFGANGLALGTGPASRPTALGPWPPEGGELGILAGNRSLNPLASAWVPAPNDGPVSVASTHLDGARDHRVLPASHTGILWGNDTARAVVAFLRTGCLTP